MTKNASTPSGVRTEHDLREALHTCEGRRIQLERILSEAHRYAYGAREKSDLQKLKTALSAAGYPPPKRAADNDEGDE
jgi:hypothetical protein